MQPLRASIHRTAVPRRAATSAGPTRHLIQLLERREAKLTQREQRDMARNVVREKKLDEAYATWAQELRGRAYVEYREPPQ